MSDADGPARVRRIGVRELRRNITSVLRDVTQGESFQITSRDAVVAELRPPSASDLPPRRPGGFEGEVWMADDFDSWPEDILESFERRGLT